MAYNPNNPNGQATMANSQPVVVASDQSSLPVTLNAETTKAIGVTRTADGSGNLITSTTNALDINIKSGNPTSITANAGTNLNTSALALETGGNLATTATNTTGLNNTVGTAASAIPSKLVQIGGSDGTNARAIKTNSSGQIDVRPLTSSDTVTVAQATASSLNATVVQSTATNLKTQAEAYQGGSAVAAGNPLQVTLANTGANATAVKVDNSAVTQPTNISQIGGSNVVTAATGVQKVGITGNTNATLDSTVAPGTAPTNAISVAGVFNSSAIAPTNGQAMAIQMDQNGNQRVFNGIGTGTLSAWTSASSLNATQNIFTNSGADSVIVQLTQTSTISAGAITFEVTFDGTNWTTIPANCVMDPTSATYAQISLPYTLQASTNKFFLIEVNGFQGLRIKLSTQITGSGSVTPNYTLTNYSPVQAVIGYNPTAANFKVDLSGSSANSTAGLISTKIDQTTPGTTNAVSLAQVGSTTVATGNGVVGAGVQRVAIASDNTAFSVNATQSGTWTVQPGNTANSTPWLVTDTPATTGGLSTTVLISAATTNATSLKASAGQVYSVQAFNTNAAARYLKFYNKASAPTVGTDTPVKVFTIPGNTAGAGLVINIDKGVAFSTGIAYALTTGVANSDTGAVALNEIVVNIDYK